MSIVMQPDDPSVTPASIAATATAFSIFFALLVLIDHTLLLAISRGRLTAVGSPMLSRVLYICGILRESVRRLLSSQQHAAISPTGEHAGASLIEPG